MLGSSVLIVLAMIFLPELLDESGMKQNLKPIPDMPQPPPLPKPLEKPQPPIELKPRNPPPPENKPPKQNTSAQRDKQDPKTELSLEDLSTWVVQMGSFAEIDNAKQLVNKLKEGDFAAYIQSNIQDGKTIHRVQVGPMLSHAKATETMKKLQSRFNKKGIVLQSFRFVGE